MDTIFFFIALCAIVFCYAMIVNYYGDNSKSMQRTNPMIIFSYYKDTVSIHGKVGVWFKLLVVSIFLLMVSIVVLNIY